MNRNTTASSDRRMYRRLLGYVQPYWRVFAAALLAMIIQAATEPAKAAQVKPLLDQLFVERDPQMLVIIPVLIVIVFVVSGTAAFCSGAAVHWIANRVVADLRHEMFSRLLEFPGRHYDHYSTAGLISKFTYDVLQIREASSNALTIMVKDALVIVGLLAWMLYMDWRLTCLALFAAPFISLIVYLIRNRLRRMSSRVQDTMVDINRVLGEVIEGHRIVKLFGGQDRERNRFREINEANRRYTMKFVYASAASGPAVLLIAAIALAVIIYTAANRALAEQLSVGEFASFLTAMLMIMDPLKRLVRINEHIQKGLAACESIFMLLDEAVEQDLGTQELREFRGEIEFRDLDFHYADGEAAVLEGVNLHIRPGEMVALVGASGSGKTTLINLIPRFYASARGRIFLDGADILDIRLAALRECLSLVSQDVILFNDTVRNNIAYGAQAGADDGAVAAAARAAHAMDFISALPRGMDTVIGEKGARLSGGQRQRIALARALLKDAPVLILDEATSALDAESERQIQLALEEIRRARTCIVIAHRLSTIETADRVIVLDRGRITEQGTHGELLRRRGVYAGFFAAGAAGGEGQQDAPPGR